ncbi:F-box only protein 15-like [Astyanax mexicanus]|uniref:F-box only protein 15-like n=1 Tax=Astyanax mexicanus TaxID=7994 RepID=A0A8T2L487_ASTMX|nr:F-box only protein 15-like [Astyanax mexicanus]
MAAGRAQFFRSLLQGLELARPGLGGDREKKQSRPAGAGAGRKAGAAHLSHRAESSESTQPVLPRPPVLPNPPLLPRPPFLPRPPLLPLPPTATSPGTSTSSASHSSENYFDRLPPELILKILSYLDADSLFCVGFVSKLFYKLANDKGIWYELYINEVDRKKWRPRLGFRPEDTTGTQDIPLGFWKRLVLREMGCPNDNLWKRELRHINPYTGMPAQVKQILGSLRVTWEITLAVKGGQEVIFKHSHTFFSDSSVTVCWSHGLWPHIRQVSTLQLHGVIQPFMGATTDKPQWRSLISKTMCGQTRWRIIATDKLVKLLQFDDGITVGIWRGTWAIAFVMANLHFHRLVERSLLGSLCCPYRPPEVSQLYSGQRDPGCGLRGYTVLIILHNSVRRIMRRRYSSVHCMTDQIHKGFVYFKLRTDHTPVSGLISFPWKAEGLQGDIKNCCMMTLTMLDEDQRPFWCVSSAVNFVMRASDPEQSALLYMDGEGRVWTNFMWMPDMQQYFLLGIHIRIPLKKLNQHFGSDFSSSLGQ